MVFKNRFAAKHDFKMKKYCKRCGRKVEGRLSYGAILPWYCKKCDMAYFDEGVENFSKMKKIIFEYECFEKQEDVRKHIQACEGKHIQQAIYSTFHDCLTQVCFGCRKIRTNLKIYEIT